MRKIIYLNKTQVERIIEDNPLMKNARNRKLKVYGSFAMSGLDDDSVEYMVNHLREKTTINFPVTSRDGVKNIKKTMELRNLLYESIDSYYRFLPALKELELKNGDFFLSEVVANYLDKERIEKEDKSWKLSHLFIFVCSVNEDTVNIDMDIFDLESYVKECLIG